MSGGFVGEEDGGGGEGSEEGGGEHCEIWMEGGEEGRRRESRVRCSILESCRFELELESQRTSIRQQISMPETQSHSNNHPRTK